MAAVLRCANGGSSSEKLSFGVAALVIDRDVRETTVGGERIDLTRSEFDLLHALPSRPGRAFCP